MVNTSTSMEPLSAEYFSALSSSLPPEEVETLLLLPNFNVSSFNNRITPETTLQYLHAVLSLSPIFNSNENHTVASSSAAAAAASAVKRDTSRTSSESSPPTTDRSRVRSILLYTSIRNAAALLAGADSSQHRHKISTCGILPKLKSIPNDPHAHVEFLQCCILASQYRYARRFMNVHMKIDNVNTQRNTHTCKNDTNMNPLANSTTMKYIQITNEGTNDQNTELFLRYHYLRGIIYYACNEISCAISEWKTCISVPTYSHSGTESHGHGHVVISQISLCAWKKMILANCLLCEYDDEEEFSANLRNRGIHSEWMGRGGSVLVQAQGRPRDAGTRVKSSTKLMDYILMLPNGTSLAVSRFLNSDSAKKSMDVRVYERLVDKFCRHDFSMLSVIAAGDSGSASGTDGGSDGDANSGEGGELNGYRMFREDGNVGMIKRLIPVMRWRKLRSISKTYTAIPLQKLSAKLSLGESDCAQFLLEVVMKQNMNTRGEYRTPLDFTVDDESAVVYFDGEDVEENLEGRIVKCMELAKRVKDLDVSLACSAEYQTNILKSAVQKESSGNVGNARSVVEMP